MKKSKRLIGNVLICTGVLLILSGGLWYAHNLYVSNRAYELGVEQVAKVKDAIDSRIEAKTDTVSESEPFGEMTITLEAPVKQLPVVMIDDYPYCGYLSIPDIDLEMPVVNDTTTKNMKYSLCRYKGDPYQNNMIIDGHNYRSVFRKLRDLEIGDDVFFTDMDGEVFHYTVLENEVIAGTDIDGMIGGEWDLTLFTCTYGGADRYTIRCVEA